MSRHPTQRQMKFHGSQTGPPPTVTENMFLPSQSTWAGLNNNQPMMLDPNMFAKMQQMQLQQRFQSPGLDPRLVQTSPGMSSAAMNLLMLQQQMNAALLTQSMDSAGEVSNSIGSDDASFTHPGMNNMLMKMDIPTANFTKAINFETFANGGLDGGLKDVDGEEGGFEDEGDFESVEDEGSLPQNSFDTSSDLIEQQQAQQQSTLMDKFKKIREWQEKQQEMLMMQQQHQLQVLREEQERVQRMVVKQREMQWGASPVAGQNSIATHNPPMSSPRKSNVRTSGGLSHTMGPIGKGIPALNKQQPGRPVPDLPPEDLHSMNPHLTEDHQDLHSDCASQHSMDEEGVFPLPESTTKNYPQPPRTAPTVTHLPNQAEERTPNFGNTFPGNLALFTAANMKQNLYHQMLAHQGGALNGIVENMNDGHIESVSDEEGVGASIPYLQEEEQLSVPTMDGLDFRESMGYQHERRFSPHDPSGDDHREDGEMEEYYEEEEDVDGYEEDESCHCEGNETADFDDQPVLGLGAKKKTFEELLEEELRKEEERQKQGVSSPTQASPPGKKRQFLRRGEGIARFSNGTAGRRPSPTKKRPRSRSRGPEKKTTDNTERVEQRSGRNTADGSGDGPSNRQKTQLPDMPHTRALPPKGNRRTPENAANQKPASKVNQRKPNQAQKPGAGSQRSVGKPGSKPPQPQGKRLLLNKATPIIKPDNIEKPAPETPSLTEADSDSDPRSVHDTPSKYSDTSSLGETSFRARLTARAELEVYEKHDLEEFEMLEQYADDNVSFLSNVSAVNRLVQETRGTSKAQMPSNYVKNRSSQVPKDVISTPVTTPAVPVITKPCPKTTHKDDPSISSSSDSGDGTSVTSDFDEEPQITAREKKDNHREDDLDNTLVDSNDVKTDPPPLTNTCTETNAETVNFLKPVQRKVAVKTQSKQSDLDSVSLRKNILASVQQFSDSDAEVRNSRESDAMSDGEEGGKHSENTLYGANQKSHSSPPTDNIDKVQSSDRNIHIYQPEYIDTTDDEKSTDDVMKVLKEEVKPVTSQFDFNDDEEWNESQCEGEEESPIPTSTESLITNQVIRKSILNRETVLPKPPVEDASPTVPPTSQLVGKLFPKLKQDKPKPKIDPRDEQKLVQARKAEPSEGVQSKQLRDKLMELEQEIEKFRSENNALAKLRKDREDGLEQLKKEMVEFEKQKDGELRRLQEFKSEEMKKLKRERKQFEVYQQNIRAMPNKKEREEIETLKTQLSDLQDEIKRKESRWTSGMARLREKCESLTSENDELKEEIKILEKQRLAAWQRKEAAPKTKEEPRVAAGASSKAAGAASSQQVKSSSQVKTTSQADTQPTRPAAGGTRDIPLPNTNNLDLNDSDLKAAAEPPTPHKAAQKVSENGLNQTGQNTGLPPPSSEPAASGEVQRSIPRKRAVPQNITDTVDKGNEEYEEIQHTDGKVEKIYANGAREILFANGTRKQVSSDGQSIIVSFFNGDMKQILPDQRVVYYYSEAQTSHTTYPDGLEILQFPNQQMEKHYPDGTKEIVFPDQTIKYLFPNGVEESIHADGTVIRVEKSGQKTVEFPNGQREVHTEQYKRREYPDGTVKTVYPDGRQETRYSSGRVRVKDNQGNVIIDKRM